MLNRAVASFLILGCTLVLVGVTLVVLSFNEAAPVGLDCELWRINSVEGWSLVVYKGGEGGGVADQELGRGVTRIAKIDNGFVVDQRDGRLFAVMHDGGLWKTTELSRDHHVDSMVFHKPGDLRMWLIIRRRWWVLALESTAGILAVAACWRRKPTQQERIAKLLRNAS